MSFETHTREDLLWLSSSVLDGQAVRHGFSTRLGGVSPAPWDSLNLGLSRGDCTENLRENYRRFCAAVGTDWQRTVISQQTHSQNIRVVTQADAGKGIVCPRDYTDVDAMMTDVPGLSLVVFSADCGTILLHDPVRRCIAAVHAGWRGAAMGLAAKTALRMQEIYGTRPEDLRSALGPAIGSCCFETDDDVPRAMHEALGAEADPFMTRQGEKWHIDLKGINAHWLRRLGVQHIDICTDCTACMPRLYWSHRKMGNRRGGQGALICLAP